MLKGKLPADYVTYAQIVIAASTVLYTTRRGAKTLYNKMSKKPMTKTHQRVKKGKAPKP